MATTALSTGNLTLVDLAKRTKDGAMIPIVEALQQKNSYLQSRVWKDGNTDLGHIVAARNSLPSISWVRLNEGVLPSKSTVDTYTEGTGILEGLSSLEEKLVSVNGNTPGYRAQEDDAFLAQMANTLESAFFYESTLANPERIMGLSARLGSTTGKYGNQIVKAQTADTGADQNSIWMIGWSDRTVYGITPRGQPTGLTADDRGLQRDKDSTTGKVTYKWETMFRWRCGLCVEDYRYVVRVANIASSTLTINGGAGGGSGADIIAAMVMAWYRIFDPKQARMALYCNRTVAAYLHMQALRGTANSALTVLPAPMIGSPGYSGQPITAFMGAPIYVTDGLTNTETYVS